MSASAPCRPSIPTRSSPVASSTTAGRPGRARHLADRLLAKTGVMDPPAARRPSRGRAWPVRGGRRSPRSAGAAPWLEPWQMAPKRRSVTAVSGPIRNGAPACSRALLEVRQQIARAAHGRQAAATAGVRTIAIQRRRWLRPTPEGTGTRSGEHPRQAPGPSSSCGRSRVVVACTRCPHECGGGVLKTTAQLRTSSG